MNDNIKIISIITYTNTDTDKFLIYKENIRRSGIYRWNNLINNKSYVGSSISLSKRFSNYYSSAFLSRTLNKENSGIYNAILKYGYSNFSLDILEYCKPDLLIKREQYYIDLLKPEYNILKVAGSILGYRHSEATKAQMSINNTGINNPIFGKKHSCETRKKIGESLKLNITPKVMTFETRLLISSRSHGIRVKIFDKLNNLVDEFPTIISAAKHLDVDPKKISMIYKTGKSYDDYIYKFEVKDLRVWIYDNNYNLINIMDNIKKTSIWLRIPKSTISDYIKSGKLYKSKYFFYNVNSKPSSYYNNKLYRLMSNSETSCLGQENC